MPDTDHFPFNPFEDVKPGDFHKYNKKHVTEDFVSENLKGYGWEVYTPFNDTGIDRIISKYVCPKCNTDTKINLENKPCDNCGSDSVEIFRFIQVKTRELKSMRGDTDTKKVFGFTLKSKDIRIDPRHVYFLYSDNSTSETQDFIIFNTQDFLSLLQKHAFNGFGSFSFRKGNYKINDLIYSNEDKADKWFFFDIDCEEFRDEKGLKKLQNPQIDINLENEIKKTRDIANNLQIKFNSMKGFTDVKIRDLNSLLTRKISDYSSDESKVVKIRKNAENYLKEKYPEAYQSKEKYYVHLKEYSNSDGYIDIKIDEMIEEEEENNENFVKVKEKKIKSYNQLKLDI